MAAITQVSNPELPEEALAWFYRRLESIPARYRWARLVDLKPYGKLSIPLDKQQRVLDYMRSELEKGGNRNVILYGPPGSGKTTLMACIYRQCASRAAHRYHRPGNPQLYWMDMGAWSEQNLSHAFGKDDPPQITAKRLRRNIVPPPVLFMDELDKVGSQDLKIEALDAFLRAAYDAKCRIIITTNLTRKELRDKYDDHIFRRIDEDQTALHIELF